MGFFLALWTTFICLWLYNSLDLGRFFGFLFRTQSAGLLGRGISPSEGLTQTGYTHADIHASSGIPTQDPNVRADEDGSCDRREEHLGSIRAENFFCSIVAIRTIWTKTFVWKLWLVSRMPLFWTIRVACPFLFSNVLRMYEKAFLSRRNIDHGILTDVHIFNPLITIEWFLVCSLFMSACLAAFIVI
jgi:hypothetical protein